MNHTGSNACGDGGVTVFGQWPSWKQEAGNHKSSMHGKESWRKSRRYGQGLRMR